MLITVMTYVRIIPNGYDNIKDDIHTDDNY